jgi:hypothetical protein
MAHGINEAQLTRAHRVGGDKHEAAWVCTRSSGCMLQLLAWCSWEKPNSGSWRVFDSSACSWDSFPLLLGGLVWPQYEDSHLVLVYLVLSPVLSLRGPLFSEEEMEAERIWGIGELRGMEGGRLCWGCIV